MKKMHFYQLIQFTEVIVRLSSGNQTVSEDAGSVKVCVELDHSPLVPVSITLSTESGTALGKK